ncbi:hypothetical protein OW763_07140 [Clostridium aestuarii]|uniref:Uncharacterized protein n=1 Tax=Clostridium aestuarii TaxID=338193 RepID=A0ABT4CYR3_9CLOT|nr:hypothetical protein [Clostridium aestuarii]MCY6484127.1 hypothetical protein [Clostridium aestuarii]
MSKFIFRLIKQGAGPKGQVPLNIALVDKKDILDANLTIEEAIRKIAKKINGPVGINIFDLDAVTTSSDGIMLEGTIIAMGAGDVGKVHNEFGILYMEEMHYSEELIKEEPHLKQWTEYYKGKKLFRGPDPKKKLIPVHNVVMTGKAVNNNSATEMMNAVTMEEILLPIFGQLQLMKDKSVLMGNTGEFISVGIGMTVAEKYGRVFPTRQFKAGETAHGSGEYAKTLKKNIPCIVAPKSVLAKYIIQALKCGMVPARHIGCSPAVLAVAKALGAEIDFENITKKAEVELSSVGLNIEYLKSPSEKLTEEEIIEKADKIIPGVDNPILVKAEELIEKVEVEI